MDVTVKQGNKSLNVSETPRKEIGSCNTMSSFGNDAGIAHLQYNDSSFKLSVPHDMSSIHEYINHLSRGSMVRAPREISAGHEL